MLEGGKTVMRVGGIVVLVVVVVVATHWPVLSARATLFDDQQYLLENPLVQNPGWDSASRFLTEVLKPSTVEGYYQPLAMVSLMLDYASGGRPDNLRPFHRTSLALHATNAGLVVVLLYLLFGEIWTAGLVGLLFGVHPLTVEPIAWVGDRKTPLTTFFALWCLIFHVRCARAVSGRAWYYGASLGAYVLALLSKPTSTPLAVLLLLVDWWPLRRLSKRALLETVPFLVVGGVSAVITILSQGRGVVPGQEGAPRDISVVLTACHNVVFYLGRILRPTSLSAVYSFPEPMTLSNPVMFGSVVGMVLLAVVVVVSLRWTRALAAGGAFFVVAMFPTFLNVGYSLGIAADKYVYLPSIGLLLVVGWLLGRLWTGSSGNRRAMLQRTAVIGVVSVLGIAEAFETRRYLAAWQNRESIYRHMLTVAPDSAEAYNNLGNALSSEGRDDEAIACYKRALEIGWTYPIAHNNLGLLLKKKGMVDEAITHYREALRLKSDYARGHNSLGLALIEQGSLTDAASHLSEAVRLEPQDAGWRNNLGAALLKQGRIDEAISQFSEALRIKPDVRGAYHNLGLAQIQLGRYQEAVTSFRAGLSKHADDPEVMNSLAWVLATCPEPSLRNGVEAVKLAEAAAKVGAGSAGVLDTLAAAYAEAGRFAEAVATVTKALNQAQTGKGQEKLAEDIKLRLALYRQGKPYHE